MGWIIDSCWKILSESYNPPLAENAKADGKSKNRSMR